MRRRFMSLPTRSPARPRAWWFLAAALLALCVPEARAAIAITDDFGERVALSRPATRIIALTGAVNETLCGMGLSGLLAARTDADTEPAQVAKLPSIGTHMRPNLELVLAQAPNLVVQIAGRGESLETAAAIRRLGIPVAVFEVSDFAGLFSMATRLGTLTGHEAAAADFVSGLKKRLDRLTEDAAQGPDRPTVCVELRYPNLLAAGSQSMAAAAVAAAGGRLVPEGSGRVARLGEEELVRLDPDVYVVETGPMNPDPVPLADRPHYARLGAVRNGRVTVFPDRRLSRPGPSAVAGAEDLFRVLHPGQGTTTEARP